VREAGPRDAIPPFGRKLAISHARATLCRTEAWMGCAWLR